MKKALIACFVLFSSLTSLAQTSAIRGFVYDKRSSEVIPYASVLLNDAKTSTDDNGSFTFAQLKAGTYKVTAVFGGYKKETKEVTVKEGEIANIKFFLETEQDDIGDAKEIEGVEVTAEHTDKVTKVNISMMKVGKKEITAVIGIGGTPDIATFFQTVPGVVTTGDQGGQLYVRGGAPIQNKVMLDGMVIYNPFHSIGFFSVFDTDIIKNADIFTGGYSAEHGGRISSVMDITTRDGNKQEMAGVFSANPFGAKLLLEGPIGLKKKRGQEGAKLSYLLSAKTSYLAQSSKLFYTYVDSAGLPFNYTDIYGKISASTGNGSKFNAFGFNYTDSVTYQTISKLKWNTLGAGTNFILLLPGSPILTEGHFAYSQYGISLDDKTNAERRSSIKSFNGGFDFKYFQKRNEIKYGVEVIGYSTDYSFVNAASLNVSQVEATTELAGYVTYKMILGSLILEPGFRAHYYASLQNFSPEPRLGAKYNFTENFRMKFASGIYSQNLIAANSDRDVVNLFYGFLSGSANLPDKYTTGENGKEVIRTHDLQKAYHIIYGFEYDINMRLGFNIEGYYKRFMQLTNINRNKIYNSDDADKPDYLKLDYIIETGNAYGVDFSCKYSAKRTYLWVTYSLGKVTRWDGIQNYAPVWDRRHNINMVFSQKLGKKENWELGARWNFGSGLPFTKTAGVYEKPGQTNISGNPTAMNANDISYAFGTLNGGRLPTYHRFDISIKRKFEFIKMIKSAIEGAPDKPKVVSKLEINAGATNVYNRANVFYVERSTNEVVNQLPIIPTIGFSFEF